MYLCNLCQHKCDSWNTKQTRDDRGGINVKIQESLFVCQGCTRWWLPATTKKKSGENEQFCSLCKVHSVHLRGHSHESPLTHISWKSSWSCACMNSRLTTSNLQSRLDSSRTDYFHIVLQENKPLEMGRIHMLFICYATLSSGIYFICRAIMCEYNLEPDHQRGYLKNTVTSTFVKYFIFRPTRSFG